LGNRHCKVIEKSAATMTASLNTERFLFVNGLVIINDYGFYHRHSEEIDNWLEQNYSRRDGLVITFSSEKIKTLFTLRWGS
jgi:hypothetical protein